jgi:HEAT repeat protein
LIDGDHEPLSSSPLRDPDEPGLCGGDRGFRIRRLGLERDPSLAPRLATYLDDPQPDARAQAIDALCLINDREVAERYADRFMTIAATDPSFFVRGAAIDALARVGGPRAVATIGAALRGDGDILVRQLAARALGDQDAVGVPYLVEALEDPSDIVSHDAAVALGRLGGPDARAALVAACEHAAGMVLAGVANGIAALGDPEATAALVERRRLGKLGIAAGYVGRALARLGVPRQPRRRRAG